MMRAVATLYRFANHVLRVTAAMLLPIHAAEHLPLLEHLMVHLIISMVVAGLTTAAIGKLVQTTLLTPTIYNP